MVVWPTQRWRNCQAPVRGRDSKVYSLSHRTTDRFVKILDPAVLQLTLLANQKAELPGKAFPIKRIVESDRPAFGPNGSLAK